MYFPSWVFSFENSLGLYRREWVEKRINFGYILGNLLGWTILRYYCLENKTEEQIETNSTVLKNYKLDMIDEFLMNDNLKKFKLSEHNVKVKLCVETFLSKLPC